MRSISLFFICIAIVLGIFPLLFLPKLCSFPILVILFFIAIVLFFCRNTKLQFVSFILLSFIWANGFSAFYLNKIIFYENKKAEFLIKIKSVNLNQNNQSAFIAEIFQIDHKKLLFFQKINVSFFGLNDEFQIKSGQIWQISARLNPIHGLLNQGGFDSQRYFLSNKILFSGKIFSAKLIDDRKNLRQKIIDSSLQKIRKSEFVDILIALAFGERALMSDFHKNLFIKTGTAHLMAISGLHISLIGFFGFFFARFLQIFLPKKWIVPVFPLIFSWIFSAIYVWLAGSEPPALRSLFAISIFLFLVFKKIHWKHWQTWFLIVALLLILNPFMILSASFWLSCGSVGAILFFSDWFPFKNPFNFVPNWFAKMIYLQFSVLFLLLPMQIFFFHGFSLSSFFSNLIAIPFISFISVPLIFLGILFSLFSQIGEFFWILADFSIQFMINILKFFDFGWIFISDRWLFFSLIGWFFLIFWRLNLFFTVFPTFIVFIVLIFYPIFNKNPENWSLNFLDVGHGLAIIIEQNNHAILYDVGMSNQNYSVAEQVILPFLRAKNWQVDGIILSHDDNDHAGGFPQIIQVFSNAWLRSSSTFFAAKPCIQGENFYFQKLNFKVLWPENIQNHAKNSDSCVIQIEDPQGRKILLTGDLEKNQEMKLVEKYRNQLQSLILQVPHHGSNTSSFPLFLRNVSPKMAISSNSRFNSWNLPTQKIRENYAKYHINWLTTARFGQISIKFSPKKEEIFLWRKNKKRWFNDWIGEKNSRFE